MKNNSDKIKNSTIVIVGASSGFGRGAALELAKMGANVVVAARRTNLLESLQEEIEASGGKSIAVTADVSNPDDIKKISNEAIEKFGRIDVWVNNVGVGALGYFWEIPLDVHARVVDVNLKGLIYGTHVAMNHFIKQGGGTLINVGSIDSEVPLALQNTYASTKSAVLSLDRTLNQELKLCGLEDKINIATIMPWAVDTPWWNHAANYTGHAPRMAAMDDPQIVVDEIIKACTHPKLEMPVGPKASASHLSHHIFPALTERMSGALAKKESKKAMKAPNSKGTLFTPMQDGKKMDGGIRERMKMEDDSSHSL